MITIRDPAQSRMHPDELMGPSDLPMVPLPPEEAAGVGSGSGRGEYARLSVVSLHDNKAVSSSERTPINAGFDARGGRGAAGVASSSASDADDGVRSGIIRVHDDSKADGEERKHAHSPGVGGGGAAGAGAGAGAGSANGRPRIVNDSCAVCLEDFQHLTPVKLLPCAHGFHPECIDPWLNNRSDQCPICKASILEGLQAQRRSQQCCKNFLRCFCCLRNLNV